jgi:hypothetical protein
MFRADRLAAVQEPERRLLRESAGRPSVVGRAGPGGGRRRDSGLLLHLPLWGKHAEEGSWYLADSW